MTIFKLSAVSLILSACLILGTQSTSLRTITNAFASSNGPVSILKDSNGFYIEVNFTSSAVDTTDVGKFLVSLVNPKTVLIAKNCMSFTSFDCKKFSCKALPDSAQNIYVDSYFSSKLTPMTTNASLILSGWESKTNLNAIADCQNYFGSWVGLGRNGILGLSGDEGAQSNFKATETDGTFFSISMNKSLTGGFLYFSKNSSLVSASASPISLTVTKGATWRTANDSCSVKFPSGEVATSTASLMFDLHSETIALPESLYSQVLSNFAKYGAQCSTTSTNKPTCSYNALIAKLPTITIEIQGKSIPITPQIYLEDTVTATQSQITLLFRKVLPLVQETKQYNQDFTGSIILGQNFMSQNYLVFKKEGVEIYGPKTGSSSSSSSSILIIGAVVILVAAVGGLFVRRHLKRKELMSLSKPLST